VRVQRSLLLLFLAAVLTAALPALAQRGEQAPRRNGPGTGDPDEHLVNWKYVDSGDLQYATPITLYWFPASLDAAEKSPLMRSAALVDATARCVALRIVLPEQTAALKKLAVQPKTTATLVDRKGTTLRQTQSSWPAEIQSLVAAELNARDEAVYHDLHAAGEAVKAGDNAAAIDLYRKIWDDRCLFSMAGNEAQRALKRLGVIVKETPVPPPPDPNLQPKTSTAH
jgi:hypothetical protein